LTFVVLRDWDETKRSWSLDVSSGHVTDASEGTFHGFLYVSPEGGRLSGLPKVSAVYSDSSMLWFQADSQRWPISEVQFDYSCEEGGISHFIATARGVTVIDVSYFGPVSDPVYRSDPALDDLDIELLDFFYFISRNGSSSSWRSAVLATWGQGISS
jgi:hypothetical protein